MITLINKINSWNERILRKRGITEDNGGDYFREKLFIISIEIILSIGFLAYIPSMIFSLIEGKYAVFIIETVVLFGLFSFFLIPKIKTNIRIIITFFLLYILSFTLLLADKLYGIGLIYLIGFSVILSTFLDMKYAVVTIVINAIILILFGIGLYYKPFDIVFFNSFELEHWIVISLNFIMLNIIVSMSLAYFVYGFKKSLIRENQLKTKLKKKSERLIEAKMKAEESDQLKSSFLENVSHEFRTPMNSIMGFTEIMLHTNPEEKKRIRYLKNIRKSSEQLLQIIHNTIEYSKIELGTINLDKTVFTIVDIFDTLIEQHKHMCPPGVEYKVSGNEELITERIYTDKEKLFQIFTNLIMNAFKFTTEGEVEFGVMSSAHTDFFQFFVKDTGIGIRKEKQKDIFTRFHKEDDFKEGTGLGLSISATLIFHLGGRIWLESESGEGTTFYFIIPKITKESFK